MFTLFDLFLVLWSMITAILCIVYLCRYVRSVSSIRRLCSAEDREAARLLDALREKYRGHARIRVIRCAAITMPMGVGLFDRCILLPISNFSEVELHHILLHEYIHFRNRDLWTKTLIEVFCRLYWWNPLVYLLKTDVEQMLELKCDLHATADLSPQQRAAYLRTITACLSKSNAEKSPAASFSTKLFKLDHAGSELIERFKLVTYPVSKNNRKFQVLSIVCFSVLIIFSYMFILQPGYLPEKETGVFYLDDIRLSGYIVKHWDGRYTLYNDDGSLIPLNEETVRMLSESGFDVIER